MKKTVQHIVVYNAVLLVSAVIIFFVLKFGPESKILIPAVESLSWQEALFVDLKHNLQLPITNLLIQLVVILTACKIFSSLFQLAGQAKVVGEIFAGIFIGKSVFAYFWPEGFAFVFPEDSMPRLYFLSQIGLIFFMFVVGLELNLQSMKKRASAAVMISHASIVLPFLLGTILSLFLFKNFAPETAKFSSFALFMGIAMSITAFPVLARIIKEKNLTNTNLGNMSLTCAAVDDITAWFVLAAIIGVVKVGSLVSALMVVALSFAYIALMLTAVRPFLEKKIRPKIDGSFSIENFSIVFLVLFGSALIAEIIGIHALFGAFLAGTVMPKSMSFRANLIHRIEDVSAVALLPLFFAFTGIRTQIGLLNTFSDWVICGIIILVAVIGKLVGSALAARWSGMSWNDSLAIGTLMNTRGLMELVVLNIGYDLGLLSPAIFSMMVVMALVTTMMTAPLLDLFLPKKLDPQEEALTSGA